MLTDWRLASIMGEDVGRLGFIFLSIKDVNRRRCHFVLKVNVSCFGVPPWSHAELETKEPCILCRICQRTWQRVALSWLEWIYVVKEAKRSWLNSICVFGVQLRIWSNNVHVPTAACATPLQQEDDASAKPGPGAKRSPGWPACLLLYWCFKLLAPAWRRGISPLFALQDTQGTFT